MEDMLQGNMDEYLPLRDVVFNTLRQGILKGELKPGERLMEIHLAKRLGVSRTPIREAIRKLELEGLVIMVPRRGAQVAQITKKSLQDVLEVRRALDILSAELACERIKEADLEQIESACEDFKNAIQTRDITEIAKVDVILHDIIVRTTGNARLMQLVNNLSEQMYRYRFEYIKDVNCHGRLVEEHALIFEALSNRDKVKAAQAAALHIDNQKIAIMRNLNFS